MTYMHALQDATLLPSSAAAITTTTAPSSPLLEVLSTTTRRQTAAATATATATAAPDPPFALSVGAWQITEEDLPIYVGSAAGVLLLIALLTAVTAWRCCVAPAAAGGASEGHRKDKRDAGM